MNSIIIIGALIGAIIMAIVACIGVVSSGINYAQGSGDVFMVMRNMVLLILSIGITMVATKYIKNPDQVFADSRGMDIVNVEQTTTTAPTGIQCTMRETTEATTVETSETTIETTISTTIETTISQQELSVKELKKAWKDADKAEYKFYYVHSNGKKDKIQAKYYDCTKYNVVFDHESQVVYISDK